MTKKKKLNGAAVLREVSRIELERARRAPLKVTIKELLEAVSSPKK